jgi:hypothetical protein
MICWHSSRLNTLSAKPTPSTPSFGTGFADELNIIQILDIFTLHSVFQAVILLVNVKYITPDGALVRTDGAA